MTVLISLPVHEKPDVVIDQLRNIYKFMPTSKVVVHISKGFHGNPQQITDFAQNPAGSGFVFVNHERLDTAWAGIIQTHLSNFAFANSQTKLDFTHFAMHASNDMFVKLGAEEYIHAHDAGFQQFYAPSDMMWSPRRRAAWDPQFKAMMLEVGANKMFGSQIEGTFYSREIFEHIWQVITKHFVVAGIKQYSTKDDNDHENTLYAREELYFSTIASETSCARVRPYLWSEVMTSVKTTPMVIDAIRNNTLDVNSCVEKRICDPYYRLYETENIYAVKRVARDIRDPLRRYISELI